MGPLDVVVASVRAVIQPIETGVLDAAPARALVGEPVELTALVEQLVTLGYERVDLVERRGQVAVRGGIVHVFPAHEEHAVRVEFWGDEVDSIRYFAVADQRSLEDVPEGLLATAVHEPVAQTESVVLTDVLPSGTQILVSEPERVRSRAADVIRTAEEFSQAGWQNAAFGGEAPADVVPAAYWEVEPLREAASAHACRWVGSEPVAHGRCRHRFPGLAR
jgi:Transcription-repair coupling factor (superfamily II helicase)